MFNRAHCLIIFLPKAGVKRKPSRNLLTGDRQYLSLFPIELQELIPRLLHFDFQPHRVVQSRADSPQGKQVWLAGYEEAGYD
jgi:hypothetical protein